MIEEIINFIKNKNITILGFGLEGKSIYNFIRRYLKDKKIDIRVDKIEEKDRLQDENVNYIVGEDYLSNLESYDIILKSPGISFKNIDISSIEEKILTAQDLFLKYTKSLSIGITGTKGKSTTSSLIYNMLIEQGKKAILLGNIGIPIFDLIEQIEDDTIVVLEMSSHILQYAKTSPNIAILLNVYEEHLDHYKSFIEYEMAKFNIFKFQKETDFAIYNLDNENMKSVGYNFRKTDFGITLKNNKETENTIYVKDNYVYYNNSKIYNINDNRKLKGEHNLNNIMFVLAVASILKLDLNLAINSINNFNPLEHRLEYVATVNGVEYYNDSIATIPESTIESIKALENVNTLLVGGNDRGVNLSKLIEFLKNSKIENIICLPKTGEYIYDALKNIDKNVIKVETIKEAVKKAKELTKPNTICLLSPAASSYGYFKNFKERGNMFKEEVLKTC